MVFNSIIKNSLYFKVLYYKIIAIIHNYIEIFLLIYKIGKYIAPGTLTFCYDPSISTPLIIFPQVRKRDNEGEIG